MSRLFALLSAFLLSATAEATPLPHASGAPAGPGPGCGGGFTAARGDTLYSIARRCETSVAELTQEKGWAGRRGWRRGSVSPCRASTETGRSPTRRGRRPPTICCRRTGTGRIALHHRRR